MQHQSRASSASRKSRADIRLIAAALLGLTALTSTEASAQVALSQPYVTAGYASFEGFSGGLYLGGGAKLGTLSSLFKLNVPGDLSVEGRYASASDSSYGLDLKATSFEGVAVANYPISPVFSAIAYAGLGMLKSDVSFSFGGITSKGSASTTELIGGVGVQYEVIPRLKVEARLGLLGYGSTTTVGAQYRF
ncbi:outer membrane beta-barrel protein [Sphaerotilus mobilis]|uniref:Opacity protein-like surface antigen n=1 Tax=Sphaerotilus mobilis TaxID=47994 RepID=A0A4V2EWU6_9BURK|nr:outer membrane beta-barrel protein [Sphaerotilus mobilis]RZS57220.1 opacity protein-like surface antigen [Sphaerotilus mobilis]